MTPNALPDARQVYLVLEAVRRAERLGWKQVGLARLRRCASGDQTALPPELPQQLLPGFEDPRPVVRDVS